MPLNEPWKPELEESDPIGWTMTNCRIEPPDPVVSRWRKALRTGCSTWNADFGERRDTTTLLNVRDGTFRQVQDPDRPPSDEPSSNP